MKGTDGFVEGGMEGRMTGGAKAYLDDLACSAPGCCCQRAYLFLFVRDLDYNFCAPPLPCQPRAILACLIDKCWVVYWDGRGRYSRYCVRRMLARVRRERGRGCGRNRPTSAAAFCELSRVIIPVAHHG